MKYDMNIFKDIVNLLELVIDFFNYLEIIKNKFENIIIVYKKDLIIFFRFIMMYKDFVKDEKIEFEEIDISFINNDVLKSIKFRDFYVFMLFIEKYRNNSFYVRFRKVVMLKFYFKFF